MTTRPHEGDRRSGQRWVPDEVPLRRSLRLVAGRGAPGPCICAVQIRLSAEERDLLALVAAAHGVPRVEVLRRGLLLMADELGVVG